MRPHPNTPKPPLQRPSTRQPPLQGFFWSMREGSRLEAAAGAILGSHSPLDRRTSRLPVSQRDDFASMCRLLQCGHRGRLAQSIPFPQQVVVFAQHRSSKLLKLKFECVH